MTSPMMSSHGTIFRMTTDTAQAFRRSPTIGSPFLQCEPLKGTQYTFHAAVWRPYQPTA